MTKVVVVAPHSDDEVLGAGGTIALFARAGAEITVVTVCAELEPQFAAGDQKMIQEEARRAHELLGVRESIFFDYPTTGVNQVPVSELNGRMQQVMDERGPDVVLLPFPDRHIDHRVVFESAVVATRPFRKGKDIRLTAMYETISETYWNVPGAEPTFSPHWTVDITETIQLKLDAFNEMPSRHAHFPGPRSTEALAGLAQLRGSQASCGHGEAFQLIRTSLAPAELARVLP
ncbi:LmbE family N-acetylglucosaminyl deacetylase [Crossiella equi]|uniref:LmbE family N-acetylglucosaminyl deacetylase n=1 Tax=Crossiella equi TaxID=130796 RepID=A0ABS5A5N9_9PSEU|nr:PIG-L deacetylase family protein [Crossiella equi]MBP2471919.1 LmbE family N-acetylglucosaminyl deacetylase [Crossiella equi]